MNQQREEKTDPKPDAPPIPLPIIPLTKEQQEEQAALHKMWTEQQAEIDNMGLDPNEFKNHQLPLARIKKIMKSDEDVRMISAEAPVVFAKACELFILELTHRSWAQTDDGKKNRTLQRSDVAAAIARTELFDFLVDIVPPTMANRDGDEGGTGPTSTSKGPNPPPPSMRPNLPFPGGMTMPTMPSQLTPELMAALQAFVQSGGRIPPFPPNMPQPPPS